MKLEVGMYVRDKGTIKKIESIHKNCEGYKTEISLTKTYPRLQDYEIKKASFNLIDLIEVGDFVNGHKIIEIIPKEKTEDNLIRLTTEESAIYGVRMNELETHIKSILTHEQYEANCYKVGE